MKKIFLPVFLILVAVFGKAQTSLDTAVNFTVKDVNGTTHRLNEYLEQGKMVVIDFFTITCGPCSTYAPMINESYYHFGCNTSNVIFLGINWGADNAGVQNFGETYGVHYPEISGTEGNGNHVVDDYGVLSYPTVIVIMPDSYIAEKFIWPPATQQIDSLVSLHGGLFSDCTTAVPSLDEMPGGKNKISSMYPMPAQTLLTCTTSITEAGSIEVRSISGKKVIESVPVFPDENTLIHTGKLPSGYYVLVLRDRDGTVTDCRPVSIGR